MAVSRIPRIILDGDEESASYLTREGIRQLGILKESMSFGDLQQDVRRVEYIDGNRIVCKSCFGEDTVYIYARKEEEKEREPKLYVYAIISSYVTIWDLLTGEVAEDICNNEGKVYDDAGNSLVTFPCHKDDLVEWLDRISNKPTRQVLKDNPANKRDFLEDNGEDIGNESRTNEERDLPDFGLFIDNSECYVWISPGGEGHAYLPWKKFVRGMETNLHTYTEVEEHEDCTVNRGDCNDSWCSNHEMYQSLSGYPQGYPPIPDWVGSCWERACRCLNFSSGGVDRVEIENHMQFLESYKGVDTSQQVYSLFDEIPDDPCNPGYKDTAHSKNLELRPFGYTKKIGNLKMNRSLFYLRDRTFFTEKDKAFKAATWEQYCWGETLGPWVHRPGTAPFFYLPIDWHVGRYYFYSYDTPAGNLIIDHIPVRKLKNKYGTLDNYVTCQKIMRDFNVDEEPVDIGVAYRAALQRLDLGELSSYVENACPQCLKVVQEKGGCHCIDNTCDMEHPYDRRGTKAKHGGIIGENNRYAVSWCANKEMLLDDLDPLFDKKYEIQIFFKMGQNYYSEDMKDLKTGETSVITNQKIGTRFSSVQATIDLKNYKGYRKKNLTIEDEKVTEAERPRKYERVGCKDFEGNRVYADNNEDTVCPFDGTYDIYSLGEAVEELINNHYEDESNDQLLVYLHKVEI